MRTLKRLRWHFEDRQTWSSVLEEQDPVLHKMWLDRLVSTGQLPPPLEAKMKLKEVLENDERIAWIFQGGAVDERVLAHVLTALYPEYFLSISFMYRLFDSISEFAGKFQVQVSSGADFQQTLPRVKEDLFERDFIWQVLVDYESGKWLRAFSNNPDSAHERLSGMIKRTRDPYRRELWEAVRKDYEDLLHLRLPPTIVQTLKGYPFPSIHQLHTLRLVRRHPRFLIWDEMGLYKTAQALLALEDLFIGKAVILVPLSVRSMWEEEIGHVFVKRQEIAVINSQTKKRDMLRARSARFIIVNHDLVRQLPSGEYSKVLEGLMEMPLEAVVIDEAHRMTNPGVQWTRAVLELSRKKTVRSCLVLTGTPLRNGPQDAWIYAALVKPDQYPTQETFEQVTFNNPRIIANLLLPYRVRRTTDQVYDLPPLEEDVRYPDSFSLPVAHQALHDYVVLQDDIALLPKLNLLRKCLVLPELLRPFLRHRLPKKHDWLDQLSEAYDAWKRTSMEGAWRQFSADTLCRLGYTELFLYLFCHTKQGIDRFMETYRGRYPWADSWQPMSISGTVRQLLIHTQRALARGHKILVFSALFKKGITQEALEDEDVPAVTQNIAHRLRKAFGVESCVCIDGDVSIEDRLHLINSWRMSPDVHTMVCTLRTSSLGLDYTVQDPAAKGVTIIYLDLPYTGEAYRQGFSRVSRQGQTQPVHVRILEPGGTVNEGVRERILIPKERLNAMVETGVVLNSTEEQLLSGDKTVYERILRHYFVTAWQHVERMRARFLTNRGEDSFVRLLSESYSSAETYGEAFARLFAQGSWLRNPGHLNRFVAHVLRAFSRENLVDPRCVVDVGCASQNLARALDACPVGVDINRKVFGSRLKQHEHVARATNLPMQTGSMDAVVLADMLQYLTLEERAAALTEACRIVRPKGLIAVSFFSRMLAKEDAASWQKAFQDAGLHIIHQFSGFVTAVKQEEIKAPYSFRAWSLVAWVDDKHRPFDPDLLLLRTERITQVTAKGKGVKKMSDGKRPDEREQEPFAHFRVRPLRRGVSRKKVDEETQLSPELVRKLKK